MATLERFLEALVELRTKTALDSFNPSGDQKSDWYYGFVCGVQNGLQRAEELLNQQLNEVENDGNDKGRPRTHRTR